MLNPCNYEVNDLIAHEAPMILVDKVLGYDDTFIQCEVKITKDTPFLQGDAVPSYVVVEYMAQSIACHNGALALDKSGKVGIGFLLGTRRLTLNKNEFAIGDTLVVDAENLYKDGEMAAFDCKVSLNGDVVATATLNVYQPRDFQAAS